MKKIGLIIGKTKGDVKFYVSESAKEWLVGVDEPRVEAGKVTSKSSDIVDFVCYRDGVALLYFCTDDLDRQGELLYGVITIPAGIDIDGVTLENIVNEAKIDCEKCFFNPSESTKEIFNSRFGKEYPECSNRVTCQNSKNNTTFAYQKYGKSINYTYGEILERNLFSPCYNSHKAVFLISDEDVNNIIPKDGVVELTQKEVASHAILKYPTGCQYKLTIDGSPFDKDRVVTIGSIVKIHAERRGKNHYDPKEISVPINAQRVDITSTINGLTWNLRISKSWFEVVEFSKNTPIANFTIKINDKALLDYQHMSIPEADVKMANVVIEAPGYDSDAFILGTEIGKLQSESGKIKRVLKESAKMYEYIVENLVFIESLVLNGADQGLNMKIFEKFDTPITEECDCLVCGGGFAGISAALAAARLGKSVVLLEKTYMLGGLGTAGLIAVYLPLCDGRGHQVSFGIAEELLRLVKRRRSMTNKDNAKLTDQIRSLINKWKN